MSTEFADIGTERLEVLGSRLGAPLLQAPRAGVKPKSAVGAQATQSHGSNEPAY